MSTTCHHGRSACVTTLGIIFGIVFLLVGIAGFVPAITPDNLLLGIFNVDALHSVVHIVTGILFLWLTAVSSCAARVFFIIVGILYIIVGLLGLWSGDRVLGILSNNPPIAWLHLILGIIALLIGIFGRGKKVTT